MAMRTAFLKAARSNLGAKLLQVLLRNAPTLIPVDRVLENESVLVFRHPVPSYRSHFVLVPKAGYEDIGAMIEADADCLNQIHRAALELASSDPQAMEGYRLILNQGKYQEVGLIHFHLVAGDQVIATD
jgi:histidine triad (HIT) family protein